MSAPEAVVMGFCVVNGYRMPLVSRMPTAAARVLDDYGRLNRPFSFDAARITVGVVSWRDDYHTMVAVPSERDECSFKYTSGEEVGWCSVYLVPEEMPHIRAAARLLRSGG